MIFAMIVEGEDHGFDLLVWVGQRQNGADLRLRVFLGR